MKKELVFHLAALAGIFAVVGCEQSALLDAPDRSDLAPAAHGTVVVVWPGDLNGWNVSSTVAFEGGPGGPPLGTGSAEMHLDSFSAISQLRNRDYPLLRLAMLTELKYWTYVESSPPRAPVIMLNVDYDGDADPVPDDILIFDPIHQASHCSSFPQAAVAANLWQEWDALNGCWYTSDSTAGTAPGAGVKPLAAILAVEPDARIVNLSATQGGVRVASGPGASGDTLWAGFVGNADAFSIAYPGKATTFDFELSDRLASRVQCRDGGWQDYGFRNQGECMKSAGRN